MDNEFATGYALGQNDSNSNNGGMFGGDWGGLLAILVIAALFGGGFGFGGFGFGGGGAGLQGMVTRADINEGFAFNNLQNGVLSIQQGLCDGFYGVQGQLANMAAQQASCCCETQRAIERGFADTNYNMATQACETRNLIQSTTRDLIDNQNANFRALMDYQVQREMRDKDAKIVELQNAASQAAQNNYLAALSEAQTAELIRRINPTPVPSYTVPAPYPYGGWNGNGCGCGCGA